MALTSTLKQALTQLDAEITRLQKARQAIIETLSVEDSAPFRGVAGGGLSMRKTIIEVLKTVGQPMTSREMLKMVREGYRPTACLSTIQSILSRNKEFRRTAESKWELTPGIVFSEPSSEQDEVSLEGARHAANSVARRFSKEWLERYGLTISDVYKTTGIREGTLERWASTESGYLCDEVVNTLAAFVLTIERGHRNGKENPIVADT